ncbi:hypothetical protein G419_12856 [Rhodococcus triatomae BKS 15-14]|nr:hypothetical protein G419_12856 [Rhodococcus triatomae BKS 15-14]
MLLLVAAGLGLTGIRLTRDPARRAEYVATISAIRWWMVPAAVLHLTVVVCTYAALTALFPLLGWGWWRLFGGVGNVALGQTGEQGLGWSIVGFAIPVVVTALVPVLAFNEEVAFRDGSNLESWQSGLLRQARFGLAHSLFAGVPIAAGLALILSGLYYRRIYVVAARRSPGSQPSPTPAPSVPELPALPASGNYDPEEWDAALAARAAVRARRLAHSTGEVDTEVPLRAPRAVATAAAAHTVSNWFVCLALLGFLMAGV